MRTPRNPRTDQTKVRRRQQRTAAEGPTLKTCPNCHRQVEISEIEHSGGHTFMTCPNCGHHSPLAKEGRRMSNTTTVAELLRAAAKADTGSETTRLVGEAERLRSEGHLAAESSRQLDLAGTEVRDRLTPSPVHELHTAATDWIGESETGGGENIRQAMLASATEWYGDLHHAVRADAGEFRVQAEGMADRESGAFGEGATMARQSFLSMAATLRARDLRTGTIHEAEIVGDNTNTGQGAADVLGQNPPTGQGYEGLPGNVTDSNRAPAFQDMGTQPNDPGEGTGDGVADAGNGDGGTFGAGEQRTPSTSTASRRTANGGSMPRMATGKGPDKSRAKSKNGENDSDKPDWLEEKIDDDQKKEGSMGHIARCPSCQGFGAVATSEPGRQRIAQLKRQGYSGLHQIDEIADPEDKPSETAYPVQVAFPMEEGGWNPANGTQNDIAQAEQQIQQRNQRTPSVTRSSSIEDRARWAAQEAYRQVHAAYRPRTPWDLFTSAGQDDSGWLGDMGAGGVTPGEQDGGNPGGGNNLGQPDPVYGEGGDQPPGPREPVGSDERNDRTNMPDSWSVGQPTQLDQGGRGTSVDSAPSPGFPDESTYGDNSGGNQFARKTSSVDSDPEILKAQSFIRQRIVQLQG